MAAISPCDGDWKRGGVGINKCGKLLEVESLNVYSG